MKKCPLITKLNIKTLNAEMPNDLELYSNLLTIVRKIIPGFKEERSTFSQGLTMNGCLDILFSSEIILDHKIPFTHFNLHDFEYLSNLSNKIQKMFKGVSLTRRVNE
jgi:hypothetical protein